MTTKYFSDRTTFISQKFKDCKHDLTRDYSSGDLIHLYCCKCQSHYYDNVEPLCDMFFDYFSNKEYFEDYVKEFSK